MEYVTKGDLQEHTQAILCLALKRRIFTAVFYCCSSNNSSLGCSGTNKMEVTTSTAVKYNRLLPIKQVSTIYFSLLWKK